MLGLLRRLAGEVEPAHEPVGFDEFVVGLQALGSPVLSGELHQPHVHLPVPAMGVSQAIEQVEFFPRRDRREAVLEPFDTNRAVGSFKDRLDSVALHR